MIVWYASDDVEIPDPVECKTFGYPNLDSAGRTQYENTHFRTESEAWDKLRASGAAGQRLARLTYENARHNLDKATQRLALDAARRDRIEEGYEDFKRAAQSLERGVAP